MALLALLGCPQGRAMPPALASASSSQEGGRGTPSAIAPSTLGDPEPSRGHSGALADAYVLLQKMGMTEDDKRNCCLLEIQETEAKYYRTLEDIEKVGVAAGATPDPCPPGGPGTQGSGDRRGAGALSVLHP